MQLIIQQRYLVLIASKAVVPASIHGLLVSNALNHSSIKLIVLETWEFR